MPQTHKCLWSHRAPIITTRTTSTGLFCSKRPLPGSKVTITNRKIKLSPHKKNYWSHPTLKNNMLCKFFPQCCLLNAKECKITCTCTHTVFCECPLTGTGCDLQQWWWGVNAWVTLSQIVCCCTNRGRETSKAEVESHSSLSHACPFGSWGEPREAQTATRQNRTHFQMG